MGRFYAAIFSLYYPSAERVVYYPCSVCGGLATNTRSTHLLNHKSSAHGIDPLHRAEVNDLPFLIRKQVPVLRGHLQADGQKLNRYKTRFAAADATLATLSPGYVSRHGLNLAPYVLDVTGNRGTLAGRLSILRTELAYVQGSKVGAHVKWREVVRQLEAQAVSVGGEPREYIELEDSELEDSEED